jgi:hypothetical protein
MITGQIFVMPDVDKAGIERNLQGLIVTGQVYAPKSLMAAVQTKIISLTGQSLPYLDNAKVIHATLNLDNAFLNSLEPNTRLVVIGKVRMLDEIDPALFEDRIDLIQVLGKVILKEEYTETFLRRLAELSHPKIEIVPAGCEYIESSIELDTAALYVLKTKKISATEFILFKEDVTAEILKKQLSAISTKSHVICTSALRPAVLGLLNNPSTPILTYTGKLLIVDGDYELTDAELEFLDGKLTFIVTGSLTIEADISPERLLEKVESIDNFGEITGGARQLGAIKNRLRASKGELINRDKVTSENESDSNIGYLKL